MPYKRRLWSGAPRELREDLRRFRVQIGVHATPLSSLPEAGRQPVVLIVDDDEAIRSLVACFVEHLGYRTMSADGGEGALAICAEQYVDIVITDALMPRMDGRELCQRLKSTPGETASKVILMTSVYKARQYRNEAINRFGADAFLNKPLDFDALAQTLHGFAPLSGHGSVESRLVELPSQRATDHSQSVTPERRKESA